MGTYMMKNAILRYIYFWVAGGMYFQKKKRKKKLKKITNWQPSFTDIMIANYEYFEYFALWNTVSSIFVQFLKIWYQNTQRSKHKQEKIIKKIIKSVLIYFLVNFWVKNDQKILISFLIFFSRGLNP